MGEPGRRRRTRTGDFEMGGSVGVVVAVEGGCCSQSDHNSPSDGSMIIETASVRPRRAEAEGFAGEHGST